MITVDIIHSFYRYFYKKKYKLSIFKFVPTETSISHAESFIKILNKEYGNTIDREFLYNYFLFQFDYWDTLDLSSKNSFTRELQLSFIIGKKAFDRYKKRNVEYDWLFDKFQIIKKYGILKSDLIQSEHSKHKLIVNKKIDTEAPIKLAAYNTEEGFKNCIDFSTLFNHKSGICVGCNFKDECKKLLRKTYPGIYIDRGYK